MVLKSHCPQDGACVFEFAVLGGCLYVALHQFNREYAGLKVIFIGLVIAVMDECLQLASIGRHASIRDVAIDTAGVIIGVAVVQSYTVYLSKNPA